MLPHKLGRLGVAAACALALSLPLCPACASVRAEHAQTVATAGMAWARAMDAVLVLAEETAVDADSARALSESEGLTRDARRQVLDRHEGIAALVADIERLRRHGKLLGRYFEALHGLTESDADARARDAAVQAASAATDLGKELAGSTLLTASERELLGKSTGLAVRGVREAALARELEARGAVIGTQLELQEALLAALRRTIRVDSASLRQLAAERDVAGPFVNGSIADPRGWISFRRSLVLPPATVEALADAADAASRVRTAWAALVSGRFDAAAWSSVLADADTLVALVRSLQEVRR
jgi:hypothetical protein